MFVTIHQPEHLPWLGLLAKVDAADLWIVLDSVPFRKNYFQNRNRILLHDEPVWLTVPVGFRAGTRIDEIAISDDARWARKYLGRVEDAYGRLPSAGLLEPLVSLVQDARPGMRLVDLNMAIVEWLCDAFGVTTPRVLSSELGVQGAKTDLLVGLCQAVGADSYLSGPSGRDYLELATFDQAGIDVTFADYTVPPYRTLPIGTPPLASVDAMLHVAPEERRALVKDPLSIAS